MEACLMDSGGEGGRERERRGGGIGRRRTNPNCWLLLSVEVQNRK